MTQLPFELYDLVILLLREDRDALKCLSLSWRGFTPLSQRHLFCHVIIQPPWQCVREYHNVSGAASAFKRLLDISPHIGGYVKSVEVFDRSSTPLYLEPCDKHDTRQASDTSGMGWLESDVPSCLARLTELRALTIFWERYKWSIPRSLLLAIGDLLQLPSFVHLDLGHAPILSVVQYCSKNIEHLVIRSSAKSRYFEEESQWNMAVPISRDPIVLHSLCLPEEEENVISSVEEVFMDPENRICLRALKKLAAYVPNWMPDYEALGRLLRLCNQSLEELILKWVFPPDTDLLFDLNNLPSLKRLHLSIKSSTLHPYDDLAWFIDLLWVLTAAHPLEELSVDQEIICQRHELREQTSNVANQWKEVLELLQSEYFPNFRGFKLRVRSGIPGSAESFVAFFGSRDFFQRLKLKLNSFDIFSRSNEHHMMADFVADRTWLSMKEIYEFKESELPAF